MVGVVAADPGSACCRSGRPFLQKVPNGTRGRPVEIQRRQTKATHARGGPPIHTQRRAAGQGIKKMSTATKERANGNREWKHDEWRAFADGPPPNREHVSEDTRFTLSHDSLVDLVRSDGDLEPVLKPEPFTDCRR